MDGLKLKKILIGKGYMLKDIASKLGMTQPNFSQIIKAQDIKTGTLENICDVLGVKMDFSMAKQSMLLLPNRSQPKMIQWQAKTLIKRFSICKVS